MEDLRAKLDRTPLRTLASGGGEGGAEQDPIALEHSATVAEALKVLARSHIMSAPLVVSPGLEDIESLEPQETAPALVGWLDVKDVIKALLAFLHEQQAAKALPTNMLALMTLLEEKAGQFAKKRLITVVGSEDRGLVYQTDADASVLTAIRDMFLGQPDGGRLVHRLAIFDAHGSITHIVSQMDVLRLLRQHLAELGPVAGQSLADLGLFKPDMAPDVVTVAPTTPTLLAYEQLARDGLTGAPVVAPDGQLVANLSISDIRGIQPDHFGVLALPVAEFLAVKHNTSYLGYSQHSSSSAKHPFFASGPPAPGRRPASADAADADAAAAAANGEVAGGMQQQHKGGRRPSSEVGLRLITCSPEAALGAVLSQLCDNHVHRIYVCTETEQGGQHVVGVVTPTDILSLVAGQAGWLRRSLSTAKPGSGKRPAGDNAAAATGDELAAVAAAVAAEEAAAAAAAGGDTTMADGAAANGAGAAAAAAGAAGDGGDGGSHKRAKMDGA